MSSTHARAATADQRPDRRLLLDQLREAALWYAAHGWHVIPLVPGAKRPAFPTHPAGRCDRSDPWCRHGHVGWEQRATTSQARIVRAWSCRPFGVGIACGPSGLLVVDLDQPKPGQDPAVSGEQTLARLAAEHRGTLAATFTVSTASGGTHLYYAMPAAVRLGNTAGQLGRLVDTRGHGGQVVAAPTVIGVRPYTVIDSRRPAPLPDWLTELLAAPPHTTSLHTGPSHTRDDAARGAVTRRPVPERRPPSPRPAVGRTASYVAAAVAGESARVRAAQPGTRNDTLYRAAVALGQLVAGVQIEEHTVRAALQGACAGHIAVGAFTASEADATITSGLTRGAAHPRTGPEGTPA